MIQFTPLTYDALKVGEEFVSDTLLVTPEDVETYAFAVDDHHSWFSDASPFGGAIAHPTFAANQALRLRHSRYVVHAGLHAKMQFEFLEPIRVGMRVRSRARAKGFRTTLAQAMMSTAYVSEMLTRLLGAGFIRGGAMSVAFVQPVYAGDRLTVHGVVKELRPEADATRVVVDVWCENQHGQKTAVGAASGLLP